MFHNKIFFSFKSWPEEAASNNLKRKLNFSLQIDWRIVGWLQNMFFWGSGEVFCFISQKKKPRHNLLSLLCFFQPFASVSELPAMQMSWGRAGLSCQGAELYIIYLGYPEGRHRTRWDRHWYSWCLSFPISSVGLKLQRANYCLPWLLRAYLISLCSALKMKNSMQVLIIVITQTRVRRS